MKHQSFLAIILAASFTLPVFAQGTPNINQRQQNQQNRIAEGLQSGSLTANEAANLEKREAKIAADKRAAKADGVVTPAERRKLKREQDDASRAIARKKHNNRTQ